MHSIIFGLVLAAILAGCQTPPKSEDPSSPPARKVIVPGTSSGPGAEQNIDYLGLQKALGMEIPYSLLGYQEKVFNTCAAGYGYSATHNCRREYMVIINVHLQCRDSEGQVSEGVNHADLTPIANKEVRWKLASLQGVSQTDGDGFAQILAVATSSQKRQRIKLAVGNEFLYMRANEITRVVTPRPWCFP